MHTVLTTQSGKEKSPLMTKGGLEMIKSCLILPSSRVKKPVLVSLIVTFHVKLGATVDVNTVRRLNLLDGIKFSQIKKGIYSL